MKHRDGKRRAVSSVHCCHCRPLKDLYRTELEYPAGTPMSTYRRSIDTARLPRLEGFTNLHAKGKKSGCCQSPMHTLKNLTTIVAQSMHEINQPFEARPVNTVQNASQLQHVAPKLAELLVFSLGH